MDDRGVQWRESAGELSYLAIRLRDFVAALPPGTLPPRGRVPWSANELTELDRLAHALACGELDAERATTSMRAIDDLFQRPYNQTAPAGGAAEAALLEGYLGHRRTAMASLPRLLGFVTPGIPLASQAGNSKKGERMRITGFVGVILIVLGVVVLAANGISYTRERHTTDIGPVQVSTVKKGFVSPTAGVVAIVAGIVLVVAGRRRSA